MSWRYDAGNLDYRRDDQISPGGIPVDILRRCAEEFLGPHRSLHDLEPREQEVLIAEIEADMLGVDERLQIVPNSHYEEQ